jgi:hypothetical protein
LCTIAIGEFVEPRLELGPRSFDPGLQSGLDLFPQVHQPIQAHRPQLHSGLSAANKSPTIVDNVQETYEDYVGRARNRSEDGNALPARPARGRFRVCPPSFPRFAPRFACLVVSAWTLRRVGALFHFLFEGCSIDSRWLAPGGGESGMYTQIVMDRNGDTRHDFDPTDDAAVRKAMDRFVELTRQGYIAAKRTANGTSEKIKAFDPTATETLFVPPMAGG